MFAVARVCRHVVKLHYRYPVGGVFLAALGIKKNVADNGRGGREGLACGTPQGCWRLGGPRHHLHRN